MIKACSDCRYFQPGQRVSTEAHDGTCRYSPPANYSTPLPEVPGEEAEVVDDGTVQLITYVDNTYTGWPIVLSSDWCGQWETT